MKKIKNKRPGIRRQEEKRRIDRALERQKEEIRQQASSDVVNQLMIMPVYVLRAKFGFGKKRLEKYLAEFNRLFKFVARHEVSLETLADELSDTGLKYTDDGWWIE